MAYTRIQVRNLVRQRCDLENTTAQTDAEIDNHINDAAGYVHDFLIATFGARYSLEGTSITTVAGTADYSLTGVTPAAYKPIALKLQVDVVALPLGSFEWADLHQHTTGQSWGAHNLPRYSWQIAPDRAASVVFDPPPDAVHTVQVLYHPTAPQYTSDSDDVEFPQAAVDLIVVEAVIRMKDKEERDSRLTDERAMIQKRIEDWAAPIDTANPPRTIRAPGSRSPYFWRRGRAF